MIPDGIISTIEAMCRQEDTGYTCSDYLHQYNNIVPGPRKPIMVDRECRSKMVQWCYQIVDFCKFNKETVAISINFLDRFLLTELGLVTLQEPTIYQLAAMTCLYTAIKIHEPEAMDPQLVSNLSHGAYTIEQVEAMEMAILQAIQWKVNTPTALAFVRQFLGLLPSKVLDKATKAAAYDLARNQAEFSIRDYKFVTVKASTVAYAALMNALDSLCIDSNTYDYVCSILSKVVNVDPDSRRILDLQRYLYPHLSDPGLLDSSNHSVKSEEGKSKKDGDGKSSYLAMSPTSVYETLSQ